jgi:hypothetical protein
MGKESDEQRNQSISTAAAAAESRGERRDFLVSRRTSDFNRFEGPFETEV